MKPSECADSTARERHGRPRIQAINVALLAVQSPCAITLSWSWRCLGETAWVAHPSTVTVCRSGVIVQVHADTGGLPFASHHRYAVSASVHN